MKSSNETSRSVISMIFGYWSFLMTFFFSSNFYWTCDTLSKKEIPPKAYKTLHIFSFICGVMFKPFSDIIFPKTFKSMFFSFIIWPFSSQKIIFTIFCFDDNYSLKEALIYEDTETNFVNAWLNGEMSKYSGGLKFYSYFLSFLPFLAGGFLVCFLGLLSCAAIFY